MRLSGKSRVQSKIGFSEIQNCLRKQIKLTGFGFYSGAGVKAPTQWSELTWFENPIYSKGECTLTFSLA